jgi:hypothetical protein
MYTKIRCGGNMAHVGEERKCTGFMMEKPEGKRSLGRQSRRREDGIRVDFRELEGGV